MDREIEIDAKTEARIAALPCWSGPVEIAVLSGGLSNANYVVNEGAGRFVVRFGADYPVHQVSRAREVAIAEAAYQGGFSPALIHAAPGVMVTRFIEGRTFTAEDVRADLPRLTDLMRRFHQQMPARAVGITYEFDVFSVIQGYAARLDADGHRLQADMPGYLALAAALAAPQQEMPRVFGHHDLLPANFIDDGRRLWLIDFEYAGFGTPMFDLAGLASNAGCSEAEAAEVLGHYVGAPPSPGLIQAHAAMQCASLLREAMWSMVSELYLDAPGVDYVAYTNEILVALDTAVQRYQARFGQLS